MSGGNSSKNRPRLSRKQEGWEEAGGEFYQESYPGGNNEQELLDIQRTDATKLATLLPSKQVRNPTTVRRVRHVERRQSTCARTTASRDINLAMLPDLSENLSNEERTWEEIMQIKAMPLPMAHKRELKAQLQNATKLRLQGLEQLHWKRRKVWHRFTSQLGEVISKLELWKNSMKRIEGNCGTGVVSYFLFLRWLLFLNIVISTLIILFLVVPKVVLVERQRACDGEYLNSTVCCSQSYFLGEAILAGGTSVFLDILQGTGSMEYTILFQGVYSDQVYDYYVKDLLLYFDMPLAYILVAVSWFFLSLFAIVKSAAKGFKERLVESEGQFYMFCNLVFGGWDFCIHNEKSAKIKHKALFNEIRGCLEEERWKEERQLRSKEDHVFIFLRRVLAHVIVFAILIASGLAIYFAFDYSTKQLTGAVEPIRVDRPVENSSGFNDSFVATQVVILNDGIHVVTTEKLVPVDSISTPDYVVTTDNIAPPHNVTASTSIHNVITTSTSPDMSAKAAALRYLRMEPYKGFSGVELQNLFLEFLPYMCIVGLNIIVPVIFNQLALMEKYTPAFVVKVTLFRTIFLRLSSLAVLLSQIYARIQQSGNVCSSFVAANNMVNLQCWESYVGQQLYKLVLTDFFVQFVMTFFVNLPRAFIARHANSKFFKFVCEQEFYLPKHVLDVVYIQTIIWMGAFYCPLLPIVGTIFYFLIFYVKKFTCLINCVPSPTVYRASKSKSLFMFVLLISFVVSIIPVVYSIAEMKPSVNCGPYRGLSNVWEFVVLTFEKLPTFLREFIFTLGTSVFAVPAFALVIITLYYYWAVAEANRHMVAVLKNQLVLEGHDKQFLLNRLSAFIRQQQRKCERAKNRTSFTDDDSTRLHSK